MRQLHFALKGVLFGVALVLLCEFGIYYLVVSQCSWPKLSSNKEDTSTVRAFFISDPHLLGSRNGHWFDRLRREWQMERSFQTTMRLLDPDAVFVLGDLTDEGKWAPDSEFDATVERFWRIFDHKSGVQFHVVAGNHDMGFHDLIAPHFKNRFEKKFNTPSVKTVNIKDNIFVLVNSMAMHVDGCFSCSPATEQLRQVSTELNCTKYGTPNGRTHLSGTAHPKCSHLKQSPYIAPILLQHYPLYRESDAICTGVDAAPPNERYERFTEGWAVLPSDASQRLLSWIQPRLVISGHTHHWCHVIHNYNIPEVSVPSFSWRNRNNPSIVMVTVSNGEFEIGKCFLPQESTVIMVYIFGGLIPVFRLVMNCKKRNRLL